MLPHQVSVARVLYVQNKKELLLSVTYIITISNLQTLDSGILDDVPLAPQLVRQPGRLSGSAQRTWTGASLLSPRDQMDVSVKSLTSWRTET